MFDLSIRQWREIGDAKIFNPLKMVDGFPIGREWTLVFYLFALFMKGKGGGRLVEPVMALFYYISVWHITIDSLAAPESFLFRHTVILFL